METCFFQKKQKKKKMYGERCFTRFFSYLGSMLNVMDFWGALFLPLLERVWCSDANYLPTNLWIIVMSFVTTIFFFAKLSMMCYGVEATEIHFLHAFWTMSIYLLPWNIENWANRNAIDIMHFNFAISLKNKFSIFLSYALIGSLWF